MYKHVPLLQVHVWPGMQAYMYVSIQESEIPCHYPRVNNWLEIPHHYQSAFQVICTSSTKCQANEEHTSAGELTTPVL